MNIQKSFFAALCATLLAAATASAAKPQPFVFATNGLAKAAVVIAPDAPAAVRYAWSNNPVAANLGGLENLPVSPFELKIETTK